MNVDYRWFYNTSGTAVAARQQQKNGGGLPSDPWTGFNGSLALAFRLDGTRSATTYTWNVSGTGSWTVGTNWTLQRAAPAAEDVLVFDGAVTPSVTATNLPNETIGQLRVTGAASVTLGTTAAVTLSISGDVGEDFIVGVGSGLALSAVTGSGNSIGISLLAGTTGSVLGEMTVAGGAHRLLPTDAGSVTFESGSHCRTLPGFIGNVFGNSGANGVVVFRSGSTYHHGAGLHAFGLTAPNSRIVLETASLYRHLVGASGGFSGRTYGDCEINTTPPTLFIGPTTLPCTIDNLTVVSGGPRANSTPWTFNIKGNLTVLPGGTFEIDPPSGVATVAFIGTGAQIISLEGAGTKLGTFSNLEVTNPVGVNLGRYLYSEGTVTLSGGHLTTGPYLLHLGQVGSVTGPKWVIGNLGRIMPGSAGTVTRTFEVGDASRAAGLMVSFASVQDSGTVVVRTDPGDHPDLAASGLDPDQSVNRSWNAQNLGVGFTTCDVTLAFDPADVDPGADPNLFLVGKRDGATWLSPAVGMRTATSTQATALTMLSEFAVAEQAGAVGVDPVAPAATGLAPARPTPFHASTVLEYSMARAGAVELAIYTVNGRRIRTLERGERDAGVRQVGWDGRDNGGQGVPAGLYFARLVTNEGRFHRRVIKVR